MQYQVISLRIFGFGSFAHDLKDFAESLGKNPEIYGHVSVEIIDGKSQEPYLEVTSNFLSNSAAVFLQHMFAIVGGVRTDYKTNFRLVAQFKKNQEATQIPNFLTYKQTVTS